MLFKRYKEVHITDNYESHIKAKRILQEKGLDFKCRTALGQLRISRNAIFARNPILSRQGRANDIYRIYVVRQDSDWARRLLSSGLHSN